MKRVIMAMSGGVDSSVAAWLLKEKGWDVLGVTFDFQLDGPPYAPSRDAAEVCGKIGIPHRLVEKREEFRRLIVDEFRVRYFSGQTPNPCIRCNPLMKFRLLMGVAEEMGADFIATGHYVNAGQVSEWRKSRTAAKSPLPPEIPDDRFALWRAADEHKDQSYVLHGLSQEQLSRCIFPLGGMSKPEVRALAERLGMHTHNRPDSQEICFIPDNDYGGFLERMAPGLVKPGPVLDMSGREIGRHDGIHKFTIGQRKGLGIALGAPRYVVRIEPERSAVVIGEKEDTLAKMFVVRDINWVAMPGRDATFIADVKIRYTHRPRRAVIIPMKEPGSARIVFERPESAVTPGQSAVFYHDDLVLGGGTIVETEK